MKAERLRILVELRPALDGHAGIPLASRLLFRALRRLDDFEVEGLLQSGTHALAPGLPPESDCVEQAWTPDRRLNCLRKVVKTLERRPWGSNFSFAPMLLRRLRGREETLARFDSASFREYIWARLFEKSLLSEDFDLVTQAGFRVAQVPRAVMHSGRLLSLRPDHAIYPHLDTSDFDVMIAETPYPGRVSERTRLVIRYHDSVPILLPRMTASGASQRASYHCALKSNVKSEAWFVCVSNSTKNDLLSLFPEVEARTVTIHHAISDQYFDEASAPGVATRIVMGRNRPGLLLGCSTGLDCSVSDNIGQDEGFQYLLIVSTIEPRKNHLTLLAAWEQLRRETFPAMKLVLVGSLGWHHGPIVERFRPWVQTGHVIALQNVPSPELRVLYKNAIGTVCPSLSEGFDLPGAEALASGGVVVASDIAVHREIYGDAAEYFDPKSPADLIRAIHAVVAEHRNLRRDDLLRNAARLSRRYREEAVLPQWKAFLSSATSACKPNR